MLMKKNSTPRLLPAPRCAEEIEKDGIPCGMSHVVLHPLQWRALDAAQEKHSQGLCHINCEGTTNAQAEANELTDPVSRSAPIKQERHARRLIFAS